MSKMSDQKEAYKSLLPVYKYISALPTGFCQHLRLVAGQDNRVIETFSRSETQHDRNNAEYQSHNTDAAVFYSTELAAWVIGGCQSYMYM